MDLFFCFVFACDIAKGTDGKNWHVPLEIILH